MRTYQHAQALPMLSSFFALTTCFFCASILSAATPRTIGQIKRIDPALDSLLSSDEKLEVIGEGFLWCEGPVWIRDGGFLLFSDIPRNAIVRWDSKDGCRTFIKPSGYTGNDPRGGESGSNALTVDRDGHLTLCQH